VAAKSEDLVTHSLHRFDTDQEFDRQTDRRIDDG